MSKKPPVPKLEETWRVIGRELLVFDDDDLDFLRKHHIKSVSYFQTGDNTLSKVDRLKLDPDGMYFMLCHFHKYLVAFNLTDAELLAMIHEEFFAIKNYEIDRRWREFLQITSSMSPSNTPLLAQPAQSRTSTTHNNSPIKHKIERSNKNNYWYTPRDTNTTPKTSTATTTYHKNVKPIEIGRICKIVDDDLTSPPRNVSPQRSIFLPSPGFQRQDYNKYYDGYRDGLKDHPLNDLLIDNIESVHFYAPPEPFEDNNNYDISDNNTYDDGYDNDIDDNHDDFDYAKEMGLYPNCGDY